MLARSPDSSIHRSCTAGPVRASSRSTKCGPASLHRMLPGWQSPCRRSVRRSGRLSKARCTSSSAASTALRQRGSASGATQSLREQEVARVAAVGVDVEPAAVRERAGRADRVHAADEAADPFERGSGPRARVHGRNAAATRCSAARGCAPASADRPTATTGMARRLPRAAASSGPTTGISRGASSAEKPCSSRICASLQRPGR